MKNGFQGNQKFICVKHVVIIGNGIAGITAARHIRKKSDYEITVISGETDYFFSRTALMYVYMGHMKFEHTKPYEDWFWKKNRIDLVKDWVIDVDFIQKKIVCQSNQVIYRQGFCKNCFFEMPSTADWIMKPELSKAHLNIEETLCFK